MCNGRNHQVYANCLICGKIYCTKIKYRQCIFCGNQLYNATLISNLFLPANNCDNAHKKIDEAIKKSDPFLFKNYFDSSNVALQKAFNLRDKMLKNSANEEHTKIIDDSIDWFEDDIKREFNNSDVHFSNYDDEIKNEIINKYYEIFGKKFGDINIDIDLVKMKITENKDHLKIKEFNDYLNERENDYKNMRELKKASDINTSNIHNYLVHKERKNLNYINDLRKLFFVQGNMSKVDATNKVDVTNKVDEQIVACSMDPTVSAKNRETNPFAKIRKGNQNYTCHVLSMSDEEYEDVP